MIRSCCVSYIILYLFVLVILVIYLMQDSKFGFYLEVLVSVYFSEVYVDKGILMIVVVYWYMLFGKVYLTYE